MLHAQVESVKLFRNIAPPTLHAKFSPTPLKYKLDTARTELKQAELEFETAEIMAGWDAELRSCQNIKENVEKMSGNDLTGIESMDASPMAKNEAHTKQELEKMDDDVDYDVEPYVFRIPSANVEVRFIYQFNFAPEILFVTE